MRIRFFVGFSLAIFSIASCSEKNSLFKLVDSSHSGIHFNNKIIYNDSINPINEINIYNGGGVGTADFNNDGLQDLYFSGNMVANKMYLNKGDFKFEDVTASAGVEGEEKWCKGVSIVDINNDGKKDIYLAASISKDPKKRENLLYVNQGNDKNGVPHFKELAKEYGLNDTTFTVMSYFFDYDNDGDLDVYMVVNYYSLAQHPSQYRPIMTDGSGQSTGRLYRNDWNDGLKHGVFVNVSMDAGIKTEGYGHAAIITDINKDGWKDIYVSNDFVPSNILYINNHDGTFTDRAKEYFKQTSSSSMGVDMQDINNDGLLDLVELDMNPEDNFRKKMMLSSISYQTYQNADRYKYQYQYARNTLQLNQGPRVGQNDSIGIPIFSQIGFLADMAETDWSWTPLVADFDDDGFRDLIVTNGYPMDVTDHDFMAFRTKAALIASVDDILRQVPQIKIHNYAFRNKGGIQFEDETKNWGLDLNSYSNGAIYTDLDNDGDLDMVVNNINDESFVYQNTSTTTGTSANHFLNIKLSGDQKNPDGIGAWIDIYYDKGKQQVYEHSPYKGYLSSLSEIAHFGLGKTTAIDSVVVVWPDQKKQVIKEVKIDQVLKVSHKDALLEHSYEHPLYAENALFREITDSLNLHYTNAERDYVDFNIQKLLPRKFSEHAPAMAVGDLDGNGLDDMICGGTSLKSAIVLYQQTDGKFLQKDLLTKLENVIRDSLTGLPFENKDSGVLLFDADGDNDLDLYITSGGYIGKPNTAIYQDKFYINNGKGEFTKDPAALPINYTSKSCVRAVDYDKDGDLDLFVGGQVEPWSYPIPVSSFIFRNETKNGQIKFTDVSNTVASELRQIGLVNDAVFSDFDNDGWTDLILAGEWMPITFFKNEKGVFKNVSAGSGINNHIGWWNSIAPGDFDNDGDVDYIVGNLGLNSFYRASEEYPVFITAKDFDNNGSYDAFPSLYLPTSQEDPTMKEYPAHQRDDINKQMISMRAKFTNYRTFAAATMNQLFTAEQLKGSLRLKATNMASCFIRNEGNGKFSLTTLPIEAQMSVVGGMSTGDFDGDGNLDVAINGNDFGADVSIGRYDALNGLLLKGDGKGNFSALSILESGIFIPGNGKAMVALRAKDDHLLLAASQHNGPLKALKLKRKMRNIPLQANDVSAVLTFKDGRRRKQEIYYGYSFLSQSGRFLAIDDQVVAVQITDAKGSRDAVLK